MFETSNTYGVVGSSFTGSNNQSFSTRTSLGNSFCGCSNEIYRTTPSSSCASRNLANSQTQHSISGSFVAIHRNNVSRYEDEFGAQSLRRVIGFPEEEEPGYVPPTGGLDDGYASPVGDVLLPLLLMAAAYAVVRWFKNWKRKRIGKRLFCIK